MTKRPLARNVGTVCLGTVLLGLGCTPREKEAEQTDDRPPFPEERAPRQGAPPTAADIPKPAFGPLARRTLETPVSVDPEAEKIPKPAEAAPKPEKPRERLLATVSDHTLVIVDKAAPEPEPPVVEPAQRSAALPRIAANETKEIDPELARFVYVPVDEEVREDVVAATEAVPGDITAPEQLATAEPADETPLPETVQAAKVEDAVPDPTNDEPIRLAQATTPLPVEREAIPEPEAAASEVTEPAIPTKWPTPDFTPVEEPEVEPVTTASSEQPDTPKQLVEAQPKQEVVAATTTEPTSSEPEAQRLEVAIADAAAPKETPATTASDQEPRVTARRSIPRRTSQPASEAQQASPQAETPTDTAQTANLEEQPAEREVPSLASVIPSKRTPLPMVSVDPPTPDASSREAANDQSGDRAVITQLPSTSSLVPTRPGQTTLGLDQIGNSAAQDGQQLAQRGRTSVFTASAQPPVLSYQDELILEVQIKGVDASDTIIAYGTREGVYLPLGTLARILDLAITVSDDGNYANGWILDQERTLTINLREGTITLAGEQRDLPGSLAAAFDGDLFLRTDAFAEFFPLSVEANLRSQAVLIETLVPFPFQERLAREAERKRLAARGGNRIRQDWPRSETPWLLASLPLADVELRAVSDRTFGPRVEGDVLLAGDLAFLTAQAYLSGDTENGLTASLVEVGRQDPDADLLGPLQATGFAVGDVSTVSMPVGLRSVFGRGFTVTNTPQETVSVFERIDLRGILPDGYEVELYRNDILVGSTRDAVNGQYEFLQVPVDFGLNVFRLVFFGPQGQRSEQVRKISVGDGRLPQGKLVYRLGAVQKDQNVLGVRTPNFIPQPDFGTWRATGEVGYGLTSGLTTVLSGAWYQTALDDSTWTASAGVRTSIGGFALKSDIAAADGGGMAFSAGIGGRFGSSAVTLSHVEYTGNFIDETRSISGEFLKRSTELDINSTLNLGNPITGLIIPLNLRARHLESANGRKQTNAALRASTRLPGMLVSNTLEYTRTSLPQAETFSQLFGNFDLSTIGRSKVRGRLSLGYQVLPDPELVSAAVEVDYAIDEKTALRGSVGYAFQSQSTQVGVSAVRDFEKFTLALDGNYGFASKDYSVGLRLGFSFGRDPLSNRLFIARPGLASSGGAALRAFKDNDGDGLFGPADDPIQEVDFVAFNQTTRTDETGIARLSGLGAGRGVSLQIDGSTLPDIDLAAASEGIEIVPRPGRIHKADFPIVSLSEVEGTVNFTKDDGDKRGVSGVRLQLKGEDGKIASYAKTEIDGYYFFERVKPGSYTIVLDPDQSTKLNLCTQQNYTLSVGFESDILKRDVDIQVCS